MDLTSEKPSRMDPIQTAHVKLLASDLTSLTVCPTTPPSFTRNSRPVSRVETVGVVVSRDRRDKFLRFLIDDGSGCVPCILWLNHHSFAQVPSDLVDMAAGMALERSEMVRLGAVVRVRGRITFYRGLVQITAGDVMEERDPNAEVMHWLECVRLARHCYDLAPPQPEGRSGGATEEGCSRWGQRGPARFY